jgi:hypothetical protein
MTESFGVFLQEKNYLFFRIRQLQANSLWQQADRIVKYLSRFLWIRRFFKVFLFVLQLIEQSIVVIILISTALLILPLWLFSAALEWCYNRYRYRKADQKILQSLHKTKHILFWSYSGELPLHNDGIYLQTLALFSKKNITVVGVLSKKKKHLFSQNLSALDADLFTASPSYFYHLRKKLKRLTAIKIDFVYE